MIFEYLTNISKASLAIWLVALIVTTLLRYIFQSSREKKSSFEAILFLTCCTATFHIGWELYFGSLFGKPEIYELVTALWYIGFATTDWLFVFIAIIVCKKLSLARSYAGDVILIAYTVAGVLQLVRFGDRFILKTDVLGFVYTNGIPTLNTVITIVVVWQALAVCKNIKITAREA